MAHKVEFTSQGIVLDTWDAIDVSLSMVSPGCGWTVSLWWSESARSTWSVLQEVCKEGSDCDIAIDDVTQIIGVIEVREDSGGREGGMMIVSGRSKAGRLQETDADPRISVRGLSLADVMNKYLEPMGLQAQLLNGSEAIGMVSRPNALHISTAVHRRRHRANSVNIVDGFRAKPGQSVWNLLDEACRRAGFLLWEAPFPDAQGGIGLVVDVPNESGDPAYSFVRVKRQDGTYGGNIIHAKHTINGRGVPTEVTCFANNQFAAQTDARLRATLVNEVRRGDFSVRDPMPKPWFRHADSVHSVASAQREAGRMIAMATAHHRIYECTVKGYRDLDLPDAPLFTLNQLATVVDDFHGIDEKMLITEVSFHRSRKGGETTTLKLVPNGNLRVLPAPEFASV